MDTLSKVGVITLITMRTENWQTNLIQLLSVSGILVAFYLYLYHQGQVVVFCPVSGWEDCGRVSGPTAPYSSIGPVPVALIGLIGYAGIFLITWLKNWSEWLEQNLPTILLTLCGFAFLASLALTGLEIFIIHAICRYCVVSAIIATLMFLLSISSWRADQ